MKEVENLDALRTLRAPPLFWISRPWP